MTLENQLERSAYAIGLFLGDGSLSVYQKKATTNGKMYAVYQTKFGNADVETIERSRDEIEDVFGSNYRVQSHTMKSGLPFFEITSTRRDIFDFFSVNTRMRTVIPHTLFSSSKEAQKELIRGLFDSDGFASETTLREKPQWQIGFCNTNRQLVEDTASLLQRLGVKVGKINVKDRGGYRTLYSITPNIRSFIDAGLGFHAARKQDKLNRYLAQMLASETAYAEAVTPA